MSPATIIAIDGLWRCLCPSIDATLLTKAISTTPFRSHRPHHARRPRPRRPWACQARAIQTSTLLPTNTPSNSLTAPDILSTGPNPLSHLDQTSTPILYQTLDTLRTQPNQSATIRSIIRYLLTHRAEKPNIRLYEALAHANQDPSGSAAELAVILRELHAADIPPTQTLYHAMLTALAIHPDYILRTKILRDMKARGIQLLPLGRAFVALGLLRDGQVEMALDALEGMIRDVVDDLPAWVLDVFIFALARRGFVDEATGLMGVRPERTADGDKMSPLTLWYFLLDEAGRQGCYGATKVSWERLVEGGGGGGGGGTAGEVTPSDGMVMNVLHTAARYGDGELGRRAIGYLGARSVKLGIQHYEALVDCYARGRDFENAFRVLGIMREAGIEPGPGSTRGVYSVLRGSNWALKAALKALQVLKEEKEEVEMPIAVAEVVMEAWCTRGKLGRALAYVYEHLDEFCPSGPGVRTYEVLFHGLDKVGSANEAMKWMAFLREEMEMRFMKPSRAIYNAVVRCYLRIRDLDGCFSYMEKNPSLWLDEPTLLGLVQQCLSQEDPRAWDIVDEAKRRNMDIEAEVRDMLDDMSPAQETWDSETGLQDEPFQEAEQEAACAYGASQEEAAYSIEDVDTQGNEEFAELPRAVER